MYNNVQYLLNRRPFYPKGAFSRMLPSLPLPRDLRCGCFLRRLARYGRVGGLEAWRRHSDRGQGRGTTSAKAGGFEEVHQRVETLSGGAGVRGLPKGNENPGGHDLKGWGYKNRSFNQELAELV